MTKPNSALQAGGDETPVAWQVAAAFFQKFESIPAYLRPGAVALFTRPTPAAAGVPTPSAQGPAELWLQLHGDCHDSELDEPVDYTSNDVTWCWHAINNSDVRYVRADLASPVAPAGVPTDEPTDTQLLDMLRDESMDLRTTVMPTGQGDADIGWQVIDFYMDEPRERVVAEAFRDDPREALRSAWMANAFRHAVEGPRAVLSAGAPAVPLKDFHDSSSVHLAADDSSRALRAASRGEAVGGGHSAPTQPDAPLYRKKPVVIEARQLTREDFWPVYDWIDAGAGVKEWNWDADGRFIDIRTLEGVIRASEGDWIIKGVQGEMYPCKPDIFAATHEPIQCDGRDGVTGSAASSEAREATPASNGSDGHGKDCA